METAMDIRIGAANRVSAVGADTVSHWKKGLEGFAALKTALQSGDLDAAKAAFSTLHVPRSSHAKSPLAKVGLALQSGDVATAQQTLQTLLDARMSHRHKAAPAAEPTTPPVAVSGGINLLA